MSMLPRMKPRRFYDLVIEVAIVRPGPDPGRHGPSLSAPARRAWRSPNIPRPELRAVLEKTLGRAAVPGAGDEGRDRRRRLHAGRGRPAAPRDGDVQVHRRRSATSTTSWSAAWSRAATRATSPSAPSSRSRASARYGFPESHAASFAKIAYASLLDEASSSRRVLRGAAQRAADGLLRAGADRPRRARARRRGPPGLHQRQPLGLHARADRRALSRGAARACGRCAASPTPHGAAIVGARGDGAVRVASRRSGAEPACRAPRSSGWPRPTPSTRFGAGSPAGSVEGEGARRGAAAAVRRRRPRGEAVQPGRASSPTLRFAPLTDGREVVEDYRALQLSLRAHPLTFLRDELARRGVVRCADLARIRDGRHVEVAGIILVRQKPGIGQGRAVHHDRGRDRHRQRHPVARPVRGAAPHGHVGVDDRHEGAGAEGGRGHPRHLRPDHRPWRPAAPGRRDVASRIATGRGRRRQARRLARPRRQGLEARSRATATGRRMPTAWIRRTSCASSRATSAERGDRCRAISASSSRYRCTSCAPPSPRSSDGRVDGVEVRLGAALPAAALSGALAAGAVSGTLRRQENEIGRAQGVTAAFNGIVRQLRRAGRYDDTSPV